MGMHRECSTSSHSIACRRSLLVELVVAGNYQGKLRTGRWLQYEQRAHNDLYLSLMQLFGSDAVTFGNAAVNGGPLTNLS